MKHMIFILIVLLSTYCGQVTQKEITTELNGVDCLTIAHSLINNVDSVIQENNNTFVKEGIALSSKDTLVKYLYSNETLGEAYPQFLRENPDLAKHLPKQLIAIDTTYVNNTDHEEVRITNMPILTEDGLHIEMVYSGGIAMIDFRYNSKGVTVSILYTVDK